MFWLRNKKKKIGYAPLSGYLSLYYAAKWAGALRDEILPTQDILSSTKIMPNLSFHFVLSGVRVNKGISLQAVLLKEKSCSEIFFF